MKAEKAIIEHGTVHLKYKIKGHPEAEGFFVNFSLTDVPIEAREDVAKYAPMMMDLIQKMGEILYKAVETD